MAEGIAWKAATGGKTYDWTIYHRKVPEGTELPDSYSLLEKYEQTIGRTNVHLPEGVELQDRDWAALLPEENHDLSKAEAIMAYCRLAHMSKGRCYFTTNTGYIGLGENSVQEGDLICILYGCGSPLVLRPQQDGAFTLVTFTFVDGFMEGEFLEKVMR
jgi:hypothetical protein